MLLGRKLSGTGVKVVWRLYELKERIFAEWAGPSFAAGLSRCGFKTLAACGRRFLVVAVSAILIRWRMRGEECV